MSIEDAENLLRRIEDLIELKIEMDRDEREDYHAGPSAIARRLKEARAELVTWLASRITP